MKKQEKKEKPGWDGSIEPSQSQKRAILGRAKHRQRGSGGCARGR